MKVMVDGEMVDVVDLAFDPDSGERGLAVRLPSGEVDLVSMNLVQAMVPNPSKQPYFPALGPVTLDQPGYPEVFAFRGEKIPKHKQLSELLGLEVGWSPAHDTGFFLQYDKTPLGYSVEQAIKKARSLGLISITNKEIADFVEIAEKKKWGAALNPSFNLAFINPYEQLELRFPPLPDRPAMQVQSIMFPASKWTVQEAKRWLIEHGYEGLTVDRGKKQLFFRQEEPEKFRAWSWSTIPFGSSGIKARVAIPKEENPLGYSEAKPVIYSRQVAPTVQEILSRASGQDVRYFWPGSASSPDPSLGGFFAGDRYLGRSFGQAYTSLLGVPYQEIEGAAITGELGDIGASSLNGDTLLIRVSNSQDYDQFVRSLSQDEILAIKELADEAGYIGGLGDIYDDLQNLAAVWGRQINPMFANPPVEVEVVTRGKPFSLTYDSKTGRVLESGYQGIEETVVGPDMPFQTDILQYELALEKRDFSTPQEAWEQFISLDENSRVYESMDQGWLESIRDGVGYYLYDKKGLADRVGTLPDAVKAIVRRFKVTRWEDFPINLLRELSTNVGLEEFNRLITPRDKAEVELLSAYHGMTTSEIERAFSQGQKQDSERFDFLRSAWSMLEYYQGQIPYEYDRFLRTTLTNIKNSEYPFTQDDFADFAKLLDEAVNIGVEVPF